MGTARKFFAKALLGMTILTGTASAQEKPKLPAPIEQVTPLDPEAARRSAIRETLLIEAAKNFVKEGAPFSNSAYSQELKILQDNVTAFLKKYDGRIHDRAIVLDPRRYSEGLAIGFDRKSATIVLLAAQQGSAASVRTATYYMGRIYDVPKYGLETFSPVPAALDPADKRNVSTCVIVPTSDFALQGHVPQFNFDEDREYTNRHESWHCMDYGDNYRAFSYRDMEAVDNHPVGKFVHNATRLKIVSIAYNSEAFADVAALGDMVRAGHGMDVIDRAIAWRSRKTEGFTHRSMPMVQGLKDAINHIGLENFRTMSDDAAHSVYYHVREEHGMTPGNLRVALEYNEASATKRAKFDRAAENDLEVRNGIVFSHLLYKTDDEPDPDKTPQTEAEQKLAEALKQWPALDLLKAQAFHDSGKITPGTLIKAYETMLDALGAEMKANPADPLADLRMTKLQQVFIENVRDIDYVAANAAFGVDIVKAEPTLKKLSTPPGPDYKPLKSIKISF